MVKFLWGIICIPFLPFLFISILGKKLFNIVLGSSNEIEFSIITIKEDFINIVKIFYLPLRLMSIIGKRLYKNSKKIGSFVLEQLGMVLKFCKRKFHELFPSVNRRKYERLKRHLFVNKNETFLNSNLHSIVFFATLGLQCISFFTTFRGTLSFFEGIHWIAPILFTTVLQGVLLILANVAFSKKRRHAMRIVLLVFLCLISIALSYIGISISSMPPTDDYRREYEKFSYKYNEIYDEIEHNLIKNSAQTQLDNIFSSIKYAEQVASKRMIVLESQKIDLTKIAKYNTKTTTNSDGTTSTERIISDDYIQAEERNAELEGMINTINTKLESLAVLDYNNLQTEINNSNIDEIKDNNMLKEYVNNHSDIVDRFRMIMFNYNGLITYLNNFDESLQRYSEQFEDVLTINLIGDVQNLRLKTFDDIELEAKSDVEKIEESQRGRPKQIYNMLLGGTQRTIYNDNVMLRALEEIDFKYEILGNALSIINDTKLNNIYR